MSTSIQPATCTCASCYARRMTPALLLIGLGGLLLARMLDPAFTNGTLVAAFLVLWGVVSLVQRLAPRAAWHGAPASLFFPLLLIVIGGLGIARHALPQMAIGAWIADYWPVLLILWGLIRLIEHFARQRTARSGLSGGEIVLLVLIIFFGLSFSGMYRFDHSQIARYWGVNFNNWNPFLEAFNYNGSGQAVLAAGEPVVIRGNHGDVELVPGPAGAVSASVADLVHAESRDAATSLYDASTLRLQPEGNQLVVLPANGAGSNVEANLRLTLPPTTPVTIEVEQGSITIPSWSAGITLRSAHGSITASNVTGDVNVTSSRGDISLDQIHGAVQVNGGGNDVSLSNISGGAVLTGEYVGTLEFRNLAQGVRFNSSRTGLTIAALPGSLDYESDRIAVTNATQIQLRTRDEAIALRQVSGPMELQTSNDSITITCDAAPTAPISATDRNADITLHLPAASRFQLDASARNGEVHNDFTPAPGAPVTLHLETSNGTIAIRGGGE